MIEISPVGAVDEVDPSKPQANAVEDISTPLAENYKVVHAEARSVTKPTGLRHPRDRNSMGAGVFSCL
jgi:hypothetical protein